MNELGTCLFYMAPFCNVAPIAAAGIFSYTKVHANPMLAQFATTIADPDVNRRRHRRTIDERPLHDYVPLYWAIHTPMQYVVTVKNRWLSQDDLVFFVVSAHTVAGIPDILSTDGNAASDDTTFYRGMGAWDQLDWKVLRTPNCFSREYRRKKAAEVLVPDSLPRDHFVHLVVRKAETSKKLTDIVAPVLQQLSLPSMPPVVVRPDFYYTDTE
jgi:hypothetical protein